MLAKSQLSTAAKGSTHHEVKPLLSKQKVVGVDQSQFSQRRGRPDDYKRGVSSQTYYVKPEDENKLTFLLIIIFCHISYHKFCVVT